MQNFFVKSHGLGNDYIVINEEDLTFDLTIKAIKRICDVHYGIGSDGILLKVKSKEADFGLKIYNPDGSEAEKSGNGLRIFSKYLYDYRFAKTKTFSIETGGGLVHAEVTKENKGKALMIKMNMGKAIFEAAKVPVVCDESECFDHPLHLLEEAYMINCVSVGNPHCIILKDELNKAEIKKYGPAIENHPIFPNRINVQFVKVLSPDEIEILIWERGAGYTLASGSSSCAAASVAIKKGLTNRNLKVKMPGGTLKVDVDDNWNIQMEGEVREIGIGQLSSELVDDILSL